MSYPVILSSIRSADVEAVDAEVFRARVHGEAFVNMHEAYAVIAEKLDEVWEIVRQKRRNRNPEEIRKELIQLAAMAFKGLRSIDNFIGGEV